MKTPMCRSGTTPLPSNEVGPSFTVIVSINEGSPDQRDNLRFVGRRFFDCVQDDTDSPSFHHQDYYRFKDKHRMVQFPTKEALKEAFASTHYETLMRRRIRRVLIICSSYDSFTLEEDGRLETQIAREYLDLNLSAPPSFVRCNDTAQALQMLEHDRDIDLIIAVTNIGKRDIAEFVGRVKEQRDDIPIVLLSSHSKKLDEYYEAGCIEHIDLVFSWMGNADLILAIVKLIEDRMNAEHDILETGVQALLLVEDSVKYYSYYLPAIYKLLMQQSNELLKEALNEQQQILRKRARPKILFATTYEEAVTLYEKYRKNLLGVISDITFRRRHSDADKMENAGIRLCKLIKENDPLMPFVLQSYEGAKERVAREAGVGFIHKNSKTLTQELAAYIDEEFYFGSFSFKDNETGDVVGTAKDLREMQHVLAHIPDNVLLYHSSQNHLSKWMFARGLFSLARIIKSVHSNQFATTAELRQYLIGAISEYRTISAQGVIARFNPDTYDDYMPFARIGEGALGGKARGLAFINSILHRYSLYNKYDRIRVTIPRTVVVTTDYFDAFVQENGLQYIINSNAPDQDILSEFVASRLPERLMNKLRAIIRHATGPLAVRSSSKLEDTYYQPFAGIYSTYMIPYTTDQNQMLRMLGKAIKSVYASVYYQRSRSYIESTANMIDEEKMSVVVQDVCGTEDGGYFFPTISGSAQSVNFYATGNETPEDGVANIAIGLGKLVVDGGMTLRFSPKYPKHVLQLSSVEFTLKTTQREMYALDMSPEQFRTSTDDGVNLRRFEIAQAAGFRNMRHVSSTWSMENNRISDSFEEKGRKVVTFAGVLKYDSIPLAEVIRDILQIGEKEMGAPIEIEFAVNMDVGPGQESTFYILQIRPIIHDELKYNIPWSGIDTAGAVIYSEQALGFSNMEGIADIVYVKNEVFDKSRTREIAEEVSAINRQMRDEKRNYVLVGPGRWGSSDPWLGIPVKWPDISESRVIVECGLKTFRVDPSQGTHFFQNLTAFGAGYLTINPFMGEGLFNEALLDSMPAVSETEHLRHVRFDHGLFVFIDGKNNKGVVSTEHPRAEE